MAREKSLDAQFGDALGNDNYEEMKRLAAAGANVEGPLESDGGMSYLFGAAALGNLPRLNALIECGADVNHRDDFDKTALITAALGGQLEAIDRLIQAGADVNATDKHGKAAIDYSAQFLNKPLVRALAERGAEGHGYWKRHVQRLVDPNNRGRE